MLKTESKRAYMVPKNVVWRLDGRDCHASYDKLMNVRSQTHRILYNVNGQRALGTLCQYKGSGITLLKYKYAGETVLRISQMVKDSQRHLFAWLFKSIFAAINMFH